MGVILRATAHFSEIHRVFMEPVRSATGHLHRLFTTSAGVSSVASAHFQRLCEALREGNVKKVTRLLKVVSKEELNSPEPSSGALPICIAMRRYAQDSTYPGEILISLFDRGVCVMKRGTDGDYAAHYRRDQPDYWAEDFVIRMRMWDCSHCPVKQDEKSEAQERR